MVSHSILARKRVKRKPQKDDIPLTNLCRFKRKIRTSIRMCHLEAVVIGAIISLVQTYGTTCTTIMAYLHKKYTPTFPYFRQKVQNVLSNLVKANYLRKDGDRYRFSFKTHTLPSEKYETLPKVKRKKRKSSRLKKPSEDSY